MRSCVTTNPEGLFQHLAGDAERRVRDVCLDEIIADEGEVRVRSVHPRDCDAHAMLTPLRLLCDRHKTADLRGGGAP